MIWVVIVFLISRLWHLTLLPVFTDEANYVDWGWRMTHTQGHLFYSLYDSKQPLLMWLFGLVQNFIADPLLAGRLVSVATGTLTLLGLYLVGKNLYGRLIGIWVAILYTAIPLFVLFDRQALMESSLAAISIWSLYFCVRYVRETKFWQLIALGIVLGLGFFIKTSALLVIIPVVVFLVAKLKSDCIVPLVVLTITMGVVCSPLLLQAQFWSSWPLNTRYSTFNPSLWWTNFTGISDVLFWQLTPLIYLGLLVAIYKFTRASKVVFIWTMIPLGIIGLTATYIVSRYVVLFLPPLLLLLAQLPKKYLVVALIPAIALSVMQILNPPLYFHTLKKVTEYSYIEPYITHEASGYMVQAALPKIKALAAHQPIVLGLALFSGNPEVGLLIYLRQHPNIAVSYLDAQLFPAQVLAEYDCLKFDKPVYLASRAPDMAGLSKYFTEVEVLTNPTSNSKIFLSQLKTDCQGKTLPLSLTRQ